MKKITALMLSSAMMLSLAACGGSASTETVSSEAASSEAVSTEEAASADAAAVTTVNAGKLTMSTNAAFPPYEMTTDTGDFEGIDIEVAGAIAKKLGLELQVDDMDFDAALLAAQNGKSDMVMAGVTVTDERLKVMDFSDTYAEGIQSIIVPEGSDIATADDLSGKAIGTQRGTTGYIYCTDDFGEDSVVAYDDGLTAVQALNNGQVDAVVIDNAPAQEFVAANPGLKILDTAYAQEDYAIGVAKPVSIMVDTFGTGVVADEKIEAAVEKVFDLTPAAIIRDLDLRKPIYRQLAAYGHMGREDLGVKWENTDRADALKAALA